MPEPKLRGDNDGDKISEDVCSNNWIHHNTIHTYGNECVEAKEGSIRNLVEWNDCGNQLDESSGCIGSRGNENTFRWNKIEKCEGSGFRFGGDTADYGLDNNAYGNIIDTVGNGAFKIPVTGDQGDICNNSLSNIKRIDEDSVKTFAVSYCVNELTTSYAWCLPPFLPLCSMCSVCLYGNDISICDHEMFAPNTHAPYVIFSTNYICYVDTHIQ